MHIAQTFATYSSVFVLLECGRFEVFRITANACYILPSKVTPALHWGTCRWSGTKVRISEHITKQKRVFSPFLFENYAFKRLNLLVFISILQKNHMIFLKCAKKLVNLQLQKLKRRTIWEELLLRGQFRGPHFLICGPDSRTHLQYRIAPASVWYVS